MRSSQAPTQHAVLGLYSDALISCRRHGNRLSLLSVRRRRWRTKRKKERAPGSLFLSVCPVCVSVCVCSRVSVCVCVRVSVCVCVCVRVVEAVPVGGGCWAGGLI